MVFTVLAAADVFGLKLNYEFDFPVQPTMAEFQSRVSAVFCVDASARRPEGAPTAFSIHRMQIFDDRTEQWNDLLSGAQLIDYCQVYIFQKESPWHKEVQSKIPPAVKAPMPAPSALPVPSMTVDAATTATYMNPSLFAMLPAPAAPGAGPYSIAAIPPPMAAPALSALPAAAAANASAAAAAAATAPAAAAAAMAAANLPSVHLIHTMDHGPPSPSIASYQPAVPVVPVVPVVPPAPVPTGPTTPAPVSAVSPDPAACTFDQKVRSVFEVLGQADYEAFSETLAALRIDLPQDSVRMLFMKADANQDGVLQYSEFLRFCENYPTVLDSLFYRHHDSAVDAAQQDAITQAKNMVATLRERESEARVSAVQARRESDEQEQRTRQAALEVEAAERREVDAKLVLENAQGDVARCLNEVTVGKGDVISARDAEQARQVQLLEAQRNVETASLKLRNCDSDALRAEERLREIERLLLEQQKEVDRQREIALSARTDVAMAQATEQQATEAVREAEIGTRLANETLNQLEAALGAAQERERECSHLVTSAREDIARCLAQKALEDQGLAQCQEREAATATLEMEATKACDAQQDYAQVLERDNLEHNVKRRQAEEHERPLLEQEVRLRLQRETLEMEEARLRNEHRVFHSSSGRVGTPSLADNAAAPLPQGYPTPRAAGAALAQAAFASSPRSHNPMPTATHTPAPIAAAGVSPALPVGGSPARPRGLSPVAALRRQSPPQSPRAH